MRLEMRQGQVTKRLNAFYTMGLVFYLKREKSFKGLK